MNKTLEDMKKERMAQMVVEFRGGRVWLDVTDLFQHARKFERFIQDEKSVTPHTEEKE